MTKLNSEMRELTINELTIDELKSVGGGAKVNLGIVAIESGPGIFGMSVLGLGSFIINANNGCAGGSLFGASGSTC